MSQQMTSAPQRRSTESKPLGEPRHILVLFDQLKNLDGGAERSLLKLARLLPPDRYRMSIATFFEPGDREFLKEFGCPVHVLPFANSLSVQSFRAAARLRNIIRDEHVSLVQTFFETADLWGGLVAKLSGCPVLISSRRDMGFNQKRKHRIAYRLFSPLVDHVHTVSDAVRDYTIRERLGPAGRVMTIPNGIITSDVPGDDEKKELRALYGLSGPGRIVVDVAMIKPIKGFEVMARAASLVCREYPDTVFVIVGGVADVAYYENVQTLIRELDLSRNFHFPGLQPDPTPYLRMADIFCHLSKTDGLSNALLEGMGAGLPSVITRVGGNPEVTEHGGNGFVVESGDHEAAARGLNLLLSDPQMARRFGARSREIVDEKYTAESMARGFVALYDELIERKAIRN